MKIKHHDYTVEDLIIEFDKACVIYKNSLRARKSNRSNKELSRGNAKGTNIHKYQSSFAWIVHGMTAEHYSTRGRLVTEARTLIEHIISSSE